MSERRILWALKRYGKTAVATALETPAGPELCYSVNGSPVLIRRFADGSDLLREAAILRFDLEAEGWES